MNRPLLACFGILSCALALGTTPACAHEPGLSSATVWVRSAGLEVEVVLAPTDLQALLPAGQKNSGPWTVEHFQAVRPTLSQIGDSGWTIIHGQSRVPVEASSIRFDSATNGVMFRFVYPLPDSGDVTFRASALTRLSPGHREFLSVLGKDGATLFEKLLSASEPDGIFAVAPSANTPRSPTEHTPSAWGFVRLGIEHILTGYDHLLFLFGLLVVCRRFKSILAIITCFTVAHSITLALAALDIVSVPSSVVEPLIAVSIVFVGVENLFRRENPRARKVLTFLFGLIHGFGFATALRELGLGATGRGLLVPLFSFNLGVEIGQLSVAAAVLPVLWWLQRTPVFTPRVMPVLSLVVASAGLYWLLERTVLQ